MENQPEPTLVELIRYNNWANAKLLATCQELTTEQLSASETGTYGTIYATLRHIIRSEAVYIGRLTGERPQPAFKWEDSPSLADISTFAAQVAGALLDAIQQIPPTHIVHEEVDGNTIDYRASVLFIQVINHGIEHRTNITTILSGLGLPAPEEDGWGLDGWGYLFAHPETFELKES